MPKPPSEPPPSNAPPQAAPPFSALASAARMLAVDAVERAGSGHPGLPLGAADAATVLFAEFLRIDPAAPAWPDRDRFVLSAGHGSALLYALLHLSGFEGMPLSELRRFRALGSRAPGHPEHGETEGVEATSGPLGQGLAAGVGMALAEAALAAEFGSDLVDHETWVLAGDGCLMEGVSHEAASLAARQGLGRLIVLWDDNGITIDGPASLARREDEAARLEATGWHAAAVDGHDPAALRAAFAAARADPRPSLVACRTTIGLGAPGKEGTAAAHGSPLGPESAAGLRRALGWPHAPFETPPEIRAAWRAAASARGARKRAAWEARLAALEADDPARAAEFRRRLEGALAPAALEALAQTARAAAAEGGRAATRAASGRALAAAAAAEPAVLPGSADLSDSCCMRTPGSEPLEPEGGRAGRHVHYGVREHAMAGAMNGAALHGGFIPCGGTFLVFSDYARPAIRMAALSGLRVVLVMTHDSIGLGEDGPTHQPIEHLASLRAMPNLDVLRPADAVETAEAWALALQRREGPSLLALSRQALPTLRGEAGANRCAEGAYVLREAAAGAAARRATLLATGSEVSLACAARDLLEAEGTPTAVVSMPSWSRFEARPAAERAAVLGPGTARLAIEAAAPFGWARWAEGASAFGTLCIEGFGASAPGPELMERFGFTPGEAARRARALLPPAGGPSAPAAPAAPGPSGAAP